MIDLSVIIPIHKITDTELDYFKSALNSVVEQSEQPKQVVIITPDVDVVNKTIESFELDVEFKNKIVVLENKEKTDFCSQINLAVSKIDTEWFSVLELDDEYSKIWFKNFKKYQEHYNTVDMFLPIVLDISTEGRFLHFTNEPVWATDFTDKMGFLDNDALLNFPNFLLSGAVINKQTFETVGGLKPSIKLHFIYEFFLRMTYYDKTIMTIPKLGYKKVNMRPDSLYYNFQNSEEHKIDPVEARWWYNTAKKESFFKKDREIKYENELG
jgi:hypothetical protein